MKCPHCQTGINPPTEEHGDWYTNDGGWGLILSDCPECSHSTVVLSQIANVGKAGMRTSHRIVYPRTASRPAPPAEVDAPLSELYREASLIAADSPRAGGALLRRALQQLIREKAGIKKRDLNAEIDELIANGGLPSYITDIVDAVRVVGNFSAHPMKSTNTGEIIDVELGEVELCFDILDALFDFYFVQPAKIAASKAAIDAKLVAAGKPPLK